MENKKRLAQDIDIDNNPVIDKDIIPEDKNTDKDIKEITPTPTPVITEKEIKPIEQNNPIEEIPQPTIEPIQETQQPAVKNTVRYIDSGFTF
jgi:hypothetical protein